MHASVKNLRDHLSDYLRHVKEGEEIVITSHAKAVAKLIPITEGRGEGISKADLVEDIAQLHRKIKGVKLKSTMREAVISSRKQERS
jgi:prevent-host-death family protein